MKHNYLWISLLALAVTFSSCELVGDIFEAGMWTAIILIAIVVIVIFWIINRFRRRR